MLVLRVTGRATYAIDKKLIQGQRAVSAFGGMKTSEARAKGLTGATRDLGAKDKKTGSSRWSEWDAGEQGMLHLDGSAAEKEIEPGPRMQEFWGPSPTQEQYAEGRKGYGGEKDWQDKFEKKWIDEAEVASSLAANRKRSPTAPTGAKPSGGRGSDYLQNKAKLRAATHVATRAANFVPGSRLSKPSGGREKGSGRRSPGRLIDQLTGA